MRDERGPGGKSVPTPKYETYGEWIKTQPIAFQEEILGKQRAKALNDGKIKIEAL